MKEWCSASNRNPVGLLPKAAKATNACTSANESSHNQPFTIATEPTWCTQSKGQPMKRSLLTMATLLMLGASPTWASPLDDAATAYARGEYAPALDIYQSLASKGNADGQSNLGLMYQNGHGVAQDYVHAHMWFNLAAVSGHPDGAKNSSLVAALMTQAQIVQAREMAFDCQQRKFKNCD